MKDTALLAALTLSLAACGLAPPEEPEAGTPGEPATPATPIDPEVRAVPPAEYELVWEDDFDGAALDARVWTADERRRRHARNTGTAVDVSGGRMTITTFTDGGTHYTGFLTTEGKLETTYGFVEARIRFSSSPGSWCAFWLDSWSNGKPLGDPGRAGVEIDVVEHRATNQDGWDAVKDMVALNLNWDRTETSRKNVQKVVALPDGGPVQGVWRDYAVLWTDEGYTFYVDGTPIWTTAAAVSHRPEHVNLTCEVHDGTWAGRVPVGGYGAHDASTTKMEVDWVRIWRRPE